MCLIYFETCNLGTTVVFWVRWILLVKHHMAETIMETAAGISPCRLAYQTTSLFATATNIVWRNRACFAWGFLKQCSKLKELYLKRFITDMKLPCARMMSRYVCAAQGVPTVATRFAFFFFFF